MSKIFRRPMFRGGSTNMNGIMSGIEDRKKYAEGSARERLAKVAAEYPSQAIDPLSQFLIQGGLNLVSQPSTGGVFSDIATAAKEPTGQLFQSLAQRGQFDKKLAMEVYEVRKGRFVLHTTGPSFFSKILKTVVKDPSSFGFVDFL